ncbi:hypothetical protein IFO70_24000 [Phormidium tenue FACHB-886]|nr:hypothetical protein [Phormidium tenue FACHB-886]
MSSHVPPGSVLEAPAMSQDQSPSAGTPLEPAQGEAAFEIVADRLMEELFTDVERMLERGVDLSERKPEARKPEAEPAAHPTPEITPPSNPLPEATSLILAPRLTPRPSILEQAESQEELAALTDLMAQVQEDNAPSKPAQSFDKLLLSLVLVSFAAAGSLGWYFRDRLPITIGETPGASPVASAEPVDLQQKQTEDFLKYVGRSLDRIERDAKQQRETARIAAAGASPVPSPASSPATVLERIYIPVPQATSFNPPVPAVPQMLPQAPPQTAAPAAPASAAPAAPAAPNIAAASTHVLIGVLELGDRSAALFEIDGTPQRVQIGAAIGASGWTLVSVQNQEAIVRRNGEVRSIYVGQKF